ncbi:hypothetical protein TSAR_015919 [Trichomalopsis sarcophagae]|uniref:Uncharacterized protein n=1 Tax=Trichomalopsis sarcophagae TaxID=543379 RepID=A0A232EXS7_9HYME|nr:hypothetical protein TSAR_015919 [Trichomalopsis sarcophagae]
MRILLCLLLLFVAYAFGDIEVYPIDGDCNQDTCTELCLKKDLTFFGILCWKQQMLLLGQPQAAKVIHTYVNKAYINVQN